MNDKYFIGDFDLIFLADQEGFGQNIRDICPRQLFLIELYLLYFVSILEFKKQHSYFLQFLNKLLSNQKLVPQLLILILPV